MGSFSWLKADTLTKVANVVYGMPFKFLIPAEFGGGFIKEKYQDYGDLGTKDNGGVKYDMFELLAFWNSDDRLLDRLNWEGKENGAPPPIMKEKDEYTDDNRSVGIWIGGHDEQIAKLKYPLKLVSASYKGTYEDCVGRSYNDPAQGFYPVYRTQKKSAQDGRQIQKSEQEEKQMPETRGLWHGKSIDNGEWVKGYLSKSRNIEEKPALLKFCIDYEDKGVMMSCIVDPETLGACTGLRDKNKKLIFEGDILRIPGYYLPVVVHWSPTCAGFFVDDISDDFLIMEFSDVVNGEIIGNIHDNPELLERRT